MQHVGIFLGLILAAALVGCLLFSSTDLGDCRWIVAALPVSLIVVRELYEHVPGMASRQSRRQRAPLVINPVEEEDEPGEADVDETDPVSIAGLWTGTARIWPSTPGDILQILPLTLVISEAGRTAKLIPAGTSNPDTRIVRASVLEYDTTAGNVDLAFEVESSGHRRSFDTKLLLTPRTMLPEDDTDQVTVELKRATFAAARDSTENR